MASGLLATLLASLRLPTETKKGDFQSGALKSRWKSPVQELIMRPASWEMPSWYNNDPEPFSSRPVDQLVLRGKQIQISSGVTQLLKELSKSNIPACLDPFKQRVFEACIQAHFQTLSDDDKDKFIEKLGLTACLRFV